MTEFKAHLLIFAAMFVVMTAVCFGLASINAGGTAYAVAMMLVGGAAADTSSRVVMHYGEQRRRR
jgi:predicted Na+-dependent transporter